MPVAVIDKSVTPNKTYMVHADHLNRPYFMTDATRAVVWKAIYEPFGTVYSTTGTAAQTYRFPGQWFQIESGLAYNWHRHYDATLGRYVSADPLGLFDGPSVYGYVRQQPTIFTDPTGRFLWIPAVAAAGVAMLWPEPANAPGPNDKIVPPSPMAPYAAGAAVGALACTPMLYTPLFRPGGWANSNRYLRIGEARGVNNRKVFRAAGDAVDALKGAPKSHIDIKDLGKWSN